VSPGLLLLLAALAHISPEPLADHFGGSLKAWVYVSTGTETTFLWLTVASLSSKLPVLAVCLYGVYESIQRPLCRLMLPMDKAPQLDPGQFLCDAAGIGTAQISFAALLLVAAIVAKHNYKPL